MSLEKLAGGMGSLVKIILFGFILFVVAGLFMAYMLTNGEPRDVPASVSKIDSQTVSTAENVVQKVPKDESAEAATVPVVVPSQDIPVDSVESKIKLDLVSIAPKEFNEIANAYSGIGLQVKVTNGSEKVVHGIKGTLVLRDAFGDLAGSFGIKIDQTLQPGETKSFDWVYEINLFSSSDQKMTQLNKWQSTFKAEKILLD
ncbi:hypothetical protein [Acidovorax sp. JHL-3]|uniref:hypothetical protein n=1 Tax=Acidovorax sp. JHL-3 TaxID=1276755 RepID=UPI000463E83F|nr:hypothetical protein [Acidovorax sp. JHL-3]